MKATPEALRTKLVDLAVAIRDAVLASRAHRPAGELSAVATHAGGDTIYGVDKVGEAALFEWFRTNWPEDWSVELVMEGLEEATCFPRDSTETVWKCIIDPIDGTRGLMYDKRSAWVLAAIAPQKGEGTMLSDLVACAAVEIPVSKQWRGDRLSTTLQGPILAESENLFTRTLSALAVAPSQATDFGHGFASLAKFFPEGRTLTAQIEERLWDELGELGSGPSPTIFDDQYLSTGGQFYELLMGHDRMNGDLRPLVYRALGIESALVCHPYDACAWLLLQQAGIVLEHPLGGFPDAPLDTSSEVAWVAFANPVLAEKGGAALRKVLGEFIQ